MCFEKDLHKSITNLRSLIGTMFLIYLSFVVRVPLNPLQRLLCTTAGSLVPNKQQISKFFFV